MLTFKELRERLEPEDIKKILRELGVEPFYENNSYIIYPTCCHNPIGSGSNKLYYYKNTKMFRCYTECDSIFDIFELIIKIKEIQGVKIGKRKAIQIAGFKDISSQDEEDLANDSITSDLSHIIEVNNFQQEEKYDLKPINISFLDDRFTFDVNGLKPWIDENISINTMLYYNITYDPIDNCIIIPHYDEKGNVVGIRGRYLDEKNCKNKYKPIVYNGDLLNHPTNATLYGYYQNKKAIMMTKTCVLFEGEKSVLKMDTIYDKNNISVAVSGKKVSRRHLQLLKEADVNRIIIAFDADYTNYIEAMEKLEEYKKIAKPLTTFFDVSILIDFQGRLDYKDSPIDKGEEIFNELMKERIHI